MTDLNMNKLSDAALNEVNGGVVKTVNNSSCDHANVRHEPGLDGQIAASLKNGTRLIVLGDTVEKDGYVWYNVMLESGSDEAWIAGSLIG